MAQAQAGNLTQRRASQRPLAAGTPLRNPVSWDEALADRYEEWPGARDAAPRQPAARVRAGSPAPLAADHGDLCQGRPGCAGVERLALGLAGWCQGNVGMLVWGADASGRVLRGLLVPGAADSAV
jgi:hypothetical protein